MFRWYQNQLGDKKEHPHALDGPNPGIGVRITPKGTQKRSRLEEGTPTSYQKRKEREKVGRRERNERMLGNPAQTSTRNKKTQAGDQCPFVDTINERKKS